MNAAARASAPGIYMFPASFPQERIWFLEQLEPGGPTYNLAYAIDLDGPLVVDALEHALQALIGRHESLRTSFVSRDDGLRQVVHEQVDWELEVVDLAGRPPADRARLLAELREATARDPFRLDRPPLLRATLVVLADARHVLLFAVHHLVFDGWSFGVFKRELREAYAACLSGAGALPWLPIQYADFAQWQRELEDDPRIDAQLSYWKAELQDAPPALQLPSPFPRPAVQSFAGAQARFRLDPEVVAGVDALASAEEATPFMVVLAAFGVLLARLTGQDDVVVGSPVANRLSDELEDLIGCFINTLPLRLRVDRRRPFRELVRQARDVALRGYANQEVPFERLVEELRPERTLAHGAVVQVLLSLQNAPDDPFELRDLDVRVEELDTRTSKFDVTLDLTRRDGAFAATLEYRTDLFDERAAGDLVAQLKMVLEAAVARPETPVGRLPLIPPAERARLLRDGNEPAQPIPETTVAALVGATAAASPDAPAVDDGHEVVSYRELCERANRLAHHLVENGVGPGALVGVCLEPSAAVPATLLAVLEAGAAYVPLDPDYPFERLRHIARDAALDAVVTTTGLLDGTLADVTIDLATSAGTIRRRPAHDPAREVSPHDLAYVIYTSGSTGRPKGVEVTHRNLVNLLSSMRSEPGFDEHDGLLAVTSLSFDIAALEHFLPLVAGGKLVFAGRRPGGNPAALLRLLAREDVTVMQATPSLWQLVVDAGLQPGLLDKALCGGEALPAPLAAELARRVGRLWNLYGPTETTIWSTAGLVRDGDTAPTLGRPIANTQAYVLDEHLEPVPLQVAGELVLGGDGVARGYRNRPALSAERFVPDPFSGRRGGRLYRTGDVVRRRRDGELEFLGRADDQVKIRGFRIELGEIEAVVGAHETVRHCVATVREPEPGDRRIVAYVVPAGRNVDTDALRTAAAAVLPPHALPSAYVVLDALPLTPNGKVDRRALPAPVADEERRDVPARDALELKLLELWRAVLERDDVGVTDSFFDFGGHSLLALRLVELVRREIGRDLALETVFAAGTVEAAAAAIRQAPPSGGARSLVRLTRRAKPLVLCVHSLVGTALRYRELARTLDGEIEVRAFQAPGAFAGEAPLRRIDALAARYVSELAAVAPDRRFALAGYSLGGLIAFEMAWLLADRGTPIVALCLLDAFAPGVGDADEEPLPELMLARSFGDVWDADELARLAPNARLRLILRETRARGLLPPGVGIEQLRRHLDVVRAHLEATRSFEPRVLRGDLVLFKSSERFVDDAHLGWDAYVDGHVEMVVLPGTHSTLLEHPSVEVVADELRRRTHAVITTT